MDCRDALLVILSHTTSYAELRVVLYILCHVSGQGGYDGIMRLTLDELLHGRKRGDRTRIDNGTGLSKPAVLAGLRAAIEHGLIAVWSDPSAGGGRIKKLYGLRRS